MRPNASAVSGKFSNILVHGYVPTLGVLVDTFDTPTGVIKPLSPVLLRQWLLVLVPARVAKRAPSSITSSNASVVSFNTFRTSTILCSCIVALSNS